MSNDSSLSDDLLEGAEAIAEFVFGDKSRRRRVYYLIDVLPIFRLGNTVCARKSALLAAIKEREMAG
jgi:hypothetical protein